MEWEEGVCQVGKEQSPIHLDPTASNATTTVDVGAGGSQHYMMHFNYSKHDGMSMIFNGHTLAVVGDLGSLETGCCHRTRYEVLSFHFHSPAGHTVQRGNETWRAPLEMRAVHQRQGAEGKQGLVITSLLFEVDPAKKNEPNPFLSQIEWDEAPNSVGVQHHIAGGVDLNMLRHEMDGDFLAYNGSLATPTCDEGVEWRVFDRHAHLSEHQADEVADLFVRQQSTAHTKVHGNYRVTQPLNNRTVVHYHRAHDSCGETACCCCQKHDCCGSPVAEASPCNKPAPKAPEGVPKGFKMP